VSVSPTTVRPSVSEAHCLCLSVQPPASVHKFTEHSESLRQSVCKSNICQNVCHKHTVRVSVSPTTVRPSVLSARCPSVSRSNNRPVSRMYCHSVHNVLSCLSVNTVTVSVSQHCHSLCQSTLSQSLSVQHNVRMSVRVSPSVRSSKRRVVYNYKRPRLRLRRLFKRRRAPRITVHLLGVVSGVSQS
jgi:hypothetical protein